MGRPRHDSSESPNPSLIEQLRIFEQEIRKNYAVEKTLREQLDEAVAREDYEQAARLRDQIRAQTRPDADRAAAEPLPSTRSTVQWPISDQSTGLGGKTGPSTQTRRRSVGRRAGGSGRRN